MEIAVASSADKEEWDRFVRSHREARPYHLFAWREAVERAYGHTALYILAKQSGDIVGVLPLIVMETLKFHRRIVSLPYCDVGGALTIDDIVEEGLYKEAFARAVQLGVHALEIRTLGESPLPATAGGTDKVSMLLALPADSETLWNGFKSKLRSQVRKSEKNSLVFKWGGQQDRAAFYRVFSQSMLELGSPVHSRSWVDAVLDSFDSSARMGIVFHGSTPVGAGIILEVSDVVCIPWAATLNKYNRLSPNMLLYWSFLKYACDSGHACFDFGRSNRGGGTYRFKEQWGAQPSVLSWYSLRSGVHNIQAAGKGFISRGPGRQSLASIWSALPQWAADYLGPRLRRHISL